MPASRGMRAPGAFWDRRWVLVTTQRKEGTGGAGEGLARSPRGDARPGEQEMGPVPSCPVEGAVAAPHWGQGAWEGGAVVISRWSDSWALQPVSTEGGVGGAGIDGAPGTGAWGSGFCAGSGNTRQA